MHSASDSIVSSGKKKKLQSWGKFYISEFVPFNKLRSAISLRKPLLNRSKSKRKPSYRHREVTEKTPKLFIMENVDCKVKLFDKKLTEIFSKVT